MSKCKKSRYRKCGRKRRKKSYKRNYVTRTTCCKGGCVPSTQDALASTTFPGCGGGVMTSDGCGTLVGYGTARVGAPACGVGAPACGVGAPACGVGLPACGVGAPACGVGAGCACDPASFSHLTPGAYPGSTEAHLHVDRCGHVYGHSHCGGDIPHSHDSGCQDHYVGRVSDLRSLTRNVDGLNRDVLGSTLGCGSIIDCPAGTICANGTCVAGRPCAINSDCPQGTECRGGLCRHSIIDQSRTVLDAGACDPGHGLGCARSTLSSGCGSTSLSTCGNIGGCRPYTGDLVGGFRDPAGCNSINCSSCRFTSASLCDGSTTSHCNLACAAPGNCSTLPPEYYNTRAKTPDLRGFNNLGLSCVTGPLCGSKRPTVCKSKIKEVYCC